MIVSMASFASPHEHIAVDYDKPPADVFLDAIFEANVEWNDVFEYHRAMGILLGRHSDGNTIWEPIFTLLTRYAESSRTSRRHSDLAELVLVVSDALCFIVSALLGYLPGDLFSPFQSTKR